MPALISTVIEYLLYTSAAILLVIAGFGIVVGIENYTDSMYENSDFAATLGQLDLRFQFTWALLEACLAFLLAAIGIGLNHLRCATTVLRNLYYNP